MPINLFLTINHPSISLSPTHHPGYVLFAKRICFDTSPKRQKEYLLRVVHDTPTGGDPANIRCHYVYPSAPKSLADSKAVSYTQKALGLYPISVGSNACNS